MKILKTATAGTLESSDVQVTVRSSDGIQIHLESPVKSRFGRQIIASVQEVIRQYDITDVAVQLTDQGALDCVIKARVETALLRAMKED